MAAANSLQKIIQEKLQNIADLLIEFGLREPGERSVKSDLVDESEWSHGFDATLINKNATVNGSIIINQDRNLPEESPRLLFHPAFDKLVTVDSLIIGALESAFWDMDKEIGQDKRIYKMSGGCTVCISLFILGKLYVANAGDSR